MKALVLLAIVLVFLGGCAYGKNAQNSMTVSAEYEAERLKHLDVTCGRDEDVSGSVDKAVIK